MLSKYEENGTLTRGGIEHVHAEFYNLDLAEKHSLIDRIEEAVSEKHLEKLKAVKIILNGFDGADRKEKMFYFMVDREVKFYLKSNCL